MFKPCKSPAKNCPSTRITGRFSGGVTPIEWLKSKVSTVAVFLHLGMGPRARLALVSRTAAAEMCKFGWVVWVVYCLVGCCLGCCSTYCCFLMFFGESQIQNANGQENLVNGGLQPFHSLFGRKLGNILPTCFSQIGGFCKPERDFVAGRGFDGIFSCNIYMLHACWHMLLILAEHCIATPAKHCLQMISDLVHETRGCFVPLKDNIRMH